MSRSGAIVLALVAAALAGCGGNRTASSPPLVERTFGTGAHQVWVYQEKDRSPRDLVVFLHGLGGPTEDTPANHLAWLRHLAHQGSMVVYPRYERYPGDPQAPRLLVETMTALSRSADLSGIPFVLIGYSRGGGLAVTYSTVASVTGLEPDVVVGLYPAINDRQLDPGGLAAGTRFVFLVGDRDEVVGRRGAEALRRWLTTNSYPKELITVSTVASSPEFEATHLSVLEDSAGARKALWEPVDRLVENVRAPG